MCVEAEDVRKGVGEYRQGNSATKGRTTVD